MSRRRVILVVGLGLCGPLLVVIGCALLLWYGMWLPVGDGGRVSWTLYLVAQGLSLPVVAALMLLRWPGNGLGWLLMVSGIGYAAEVVIIPLLVFETTPLWIVMVLGSVHVLGYPLTQFTFHVAPWFFPDGRIPGRWPLVAITLQAVAQLVELVARVVAQPYQANRPGGGTVMVNPLLLPGWEQVAARVEQGAAAAGRILLVLALVALVRRWRRVSKLQRRRLLVIFPPFLVYVLPWLAEPVVEVPAGIVHGSLVVSGFLFPVALAYVVTRTRLYQLDRLVRRILVTSVLVLSLATVLGLAVVLLSTVWPGASTLGAWWLAVVAALAGFLLRPVALHLNSWVDRQFYGERTRPYEVLRALTRRLGDGLRPADVPMAVCQTVVSTLRLPWAALDVETGDGWRQLAVIGNHEPPGCTTFDLRYRGQTVGRLLVVPRAGQDELDELDVGVLQSLADQAAPVVSTLRLHEELAASRERLVIAREEERRWLRRDLHDGLGPALAGIRLRLDTARSLLASEPAVARLLAESAEDIGNVLDETRRITERLRPLVLDELGLNGAIAALCVRMSGPALSVGAELPKQLPRLPASTEVAVYRIVAEALANVIRHANADNATVRLRIDRDTVTVEISDDGTGLPDRPRAPGIGLSSMAERATEIGGRCEAVGTPAGTTVRAVLPNTNGHQLPLNLTSPPIHLPN